MSDAQNTLERRRRVHLSPRLCTVVSYLTDLSVELGGAVFKNPVMPASGTYDYFENNADCFPVSELGAVMIKSVHRLRRPGNPGPRIAEVCGGMLNCVGIPSVGIEAFLRDELPRYENIGTQVILSISGSEPVHYAEIAELVGDDPRIAALEMNLSCPNVGSGLPFSSDPQLLYDTVRQTRQRTTLPLYACLLYPSDAADDLTRVDLSHFVQLIVRRQVSPGCLLYTSPSPRDLSTSRMPSSA